jgi:predicted exporter
LRSREAGDLGGWQNIASLLPSQRTQQQVADVLRDPQLKPRLSAVLEEQGFKVDIFQPFFKKQSNRAPSQPKPPTPLTYRDLSDSNLAALVRPFRVQLPGKTAFVTFLRDVQNPKALGANIAHVPGATFIDQGALMTSVSESYRKRMVQLLVLGLLLVWLTLLVRYRNLRTSLAAFAPALLSAGVTVFVLFLLGLPLSLLGLTALLMILSIGVDYGVFLTESVHEQANQPSGSLHATLAGLFVAWFSTVFGFGVLALSQQPALRIIGVVAGIGVTSALLLAPTALTLLRPSAATRRRA